MRFISLRLSTAAWILLLAGAIHGGAVTTNAASPAPLPSDAPPATTVPSETAPTGDATPNAEPASPTAPAHPSTYTVATGDTLWTLSHKFNTSIRQLKKLNHLKKDALKPGQVLKIPGKHATVSKHKTKVKTTADQAPIEKRSRVARLAQPVQDIDLPASLFASCPRPPMVGETSTDTESVAGPAFVSSEPDATVPSGPMDLPAPPPASAPSDVPPLMKTTVAVTAPARNPKSSALPLRGSFHAPAVVAANTAGDSAVPAPAKHDIFNFFYTPPPSPDWGATFTQLARDLGDRNINYDASWVPPGESRSWVMDCSNTSRYLYRVATGIQLPRTASDQYYYLHLQNKAWDVPQTSTGFADCNYLRKNLKAGDLLFWENTYRPDRQPPITHVMVFLGTNSRGQWLMAGSQSTRGGEHNRRHGGPDVYVFNPTRACGGYTTWMGLVHHPGRFCAYGRPLEADKSKLAMAAND